MGIRIVTELVLRFSMICFVLGHKLLSILELLQGVPFIILWALALPSE